jgi:hypothetical protein
MDLVWAKDSEQAMGNVQVELALFICLPEDIYKYLVIVCNNV